MKLVPFVITLVGAAALVSAFTPSGMQSRSASKLPLNSIPNQQEPPRKTMVASNSVLFRPKPPTPLAKVIRKRVQKAIQTIYRSFLLLAAAILTILRSWSSSSELDPSTTLLASPTVPVAATRIIPTKSPPTLSSSSVIISTIGQYQTPPKSVYTPQTTIQTTSQSHPPPRNKDAKTLTKPTNQPTNKSPYNPMKLNRNDLRYALWDCDLSHTSLELENTPRHNATTFRLDSDSSSPNFYQ